MNNYFLYKLNKLTWLVDWLAGFSLTSYEFKLRTLENLWLPNYAGSTLRGGLGWALRDVFCNRPSGECNDCHLRQTCGYALIFETPGEVAGAGIHLSQAPRPFILNSPFSHRQEYASDEILTFGLTLVGRANNYLPNFILAFQRMGQMGIGRGRKKFVLEEVDQKIPFPPNSVYQANGSLMTNRGSSGLREVKKIVQEFPLNGPIELNFLTPLRIVCSGHLAQKISFELLIRNLLRRVMWLGSIHCGLSFDIDLKDLFQVTSDVPLLNNKTYWYDWERYSQRQKRRMKLGGLLGKVTFADGWQDFAWLLALGQLIHVGKGATFGLGSYQIEWKFSE